MFDCVFKTNTSEVNNTSYYIEYFIFTKTSHKITAPDSAFSSQLKYSTKFGQFVRSFIWKRKIFEASCNFSEVIWVDMLRDAS